MAPYGRVGRPHVGLSVKEFRVVSHSVKLGPARRDALWEEWKSIAMMTRLLMPPELKCLQLSRSCVACSSNLYRRTA